MNETPLILIVDDDLLIQHATTRVLNQAGYRTCQASNGLTGLQMAYDQKPDITLLDVNLPDMSGVEVCRLIKNNPALTGCFVIFLSGAFTDSQSQVDGLDGGADGYITRPVTNAELLARVRGLLRIQQAEQALRESEKRYRTLVNTSPDAILYISTDLHVILCNQRAAELYGVERPEQMLGMSVLDLFDPENNSWIANEITHFPKNWSVQRQELSIIRKDGSNFPAEVEAALVINEIDEPIGIISVIRDITQRKIMEQYLVHTERLTAMSNISAELAHEIKNPLQSIQSNLELVLDFALDPFERQKHLLLCYNEIERLVGLTNRLLNIQKK